MAAFDTALTPVSAAPTDTNLATLFTAAADSSVLVDVANIDAAVTVQVRIGIIPSGGSIHYKVYDVSINPGDALIGLGPWFLQVSDAIQVRTSSANDAVFSLTGVVSS